MTVKKSPVYEFISQLSLILKVELLKNHVFLRLSMPHHQNLRLRQKRVWVVWTPEIAEEVLIDTFNRRKCFINLLISLGSLLWINIYHF